MTIAHVCIRFTRRALTGIGAAAALMGSTVACSAGSSQMTADERPVVVANFYPVQWLASELVGQDAEVFSLTPEGTEPHDLALDADGQKELGRANVVLYLGDGFQPDVQRAIGELGPTVATEDLLTAPGVALRDAGNLNGEEPLAGNKDPHVWLDPVKMLALADAAAAAISTGAPVLEDRVRNAVPGVKAKLQALDVQYRRGLANCRSTELVTSHAAFGYLADRYGLRQVPIAGLSPEAEPDPKTLQSIAEVAKNKKVTTVFFEDALPNTLSKTVADEIGAQVSLLSALEFDPRGSLGPNQDYISVMTGNLDRIEKGLGCRGS